MLNFSTFACYGIVCKISCLIVLHHSVRVFSQTIGQMTRTFHLRKKKLLLLVVVINCNFLGSSSKLKDDMTYAGDS
jgi:hypothetical protein